MIKKAILCVFAISIFLCNTLYAENINYRLTQEIDYIDCTSTSVQNGPGVSIDARCIGAVMPTVNPDSLEAGKLVITGTYESLITTKLKVYFAGIWYTQGIDNELTSNNNEWRLDLRNRNDVLSGIYSVIVEVITGQNLLLRDQTNNEIEVFEIDNKNVIKKSMGKGLIDPSLKDVEMTLESDNLNNIPTPTIRDTGSMAQTHYIDVIVWITLTVFVVAIYVLVEKNNKNNK